MKKLIPAYLRVPVIFFTVMGAMEYLIDSGDRPAFIKYPMVSVFLFVFLFLLIAIEITIKAIDAVSYSLLTPEQKEKMAQATASGENDWYKNLMKKLTKSRPVEENGELLLDHNYDGIQELDNSLPPWWVYLFYACIAFSAVYLIRYEILGAPDQEMELKAEIEKAKIEVAEYMKTAPDLMDEKSVTLLTDPAELAIGKEIYTTNCMACHRADGGGQIGPNLTDENWILGGGIKNLFHTISNGGRDGKGMIAWKATLKPKEIQKVASYILSLQGTNPKDGKAPEGEVWKDDATAKGEEVATATADSTATKK